MIDPDIIYAKIGNIQNCLRRIQQATKLDPTTLDSFDVQDIFTLNLQRAVQSAIDLAAHIVAAEGLGIPGTQREYFRLLEQANVLSPALTQKMTAMVGFRNIAVHNYQELDIAVLKAILQKDLADLETFYQAILSYFTLQNPPS